MQKNTQNPIKTLKITIYNTTHTPKMQKIIRCFRTIRNQTIRSQTKRFNYLIFYSIIYQFSITHILYILYFLYILYILRILLRVRSNAHAGSRTRVTSMGGLHDAATLLRALVSEAFSLQLYAHLKRPSATNVSF